MSSRRRKLDAAVARLQTKYGHRSARQGANIPRSTHTPAISTTFPALDTALQIGGVPRGRITELVGPATSGKITLAARIIAAAHRERGALAAWLDLTHTCDPDYLHRCGVDLDRLLVVHPATGADALAITLHLTESQTLAALVFDGVAAITPGETGQLTGTLERLAAGVTRTNTAILFVTEPNAQFHTLAHVATLRLGIHRERWLMRHGDVRGYTAQVQVLKHRGGRPGTTTTLRIAFNGTVRGDGL